MFYFFFSYTTRYWNFFIFFFLNIFVLRLLSLKFYKKTTVKEITIRKPSPSFYSCHPSSPLLFPHSPLLPLFSCPLTLSHSSRRLIIRARSPTTTPRDEWILLCNTDRVAKGLSIDLPKDFFHFHILLYYLSHISRSYSERNV